VVRFLQAIRATRTIVDVPRTRLLLTLAPAIVLTAYFLIGFAVFSVRALFFGVPRDEETEIRGGSVLVGTYLRHYFFWLMGPVFRLIASAGVSPAALTVCSAILACVSGCAIAVGWFALGGWSFLISGILDALDGRLARVRGTVTPLGAAIDSILDRYSDAFVLMGLAWHYRHTWVLAFVLASFLGSSLVPYVRARGEGLGVNIRSGTMQRLERVLILGSALALSPLLALVREPTDARTDHPLTIGAIVIIALASNVTALSRFSELMRALRGESTRVKSAPQHARTLARSSQEK
jgi:phosphatidylglycerophosphate synthase